MTSNHINTEQEYNRCAGKNCKNKAKHELKVLYLNKIGYFCDQCTKDLLSLEIASTKTSESNDRM